VILKPKGQGAAQSMLLSVAMISVPVMLLAKPCILRMQHNMQTGKSKGGQVSA
jgi:hypothetical protein